MDGSFFREEDLSFYAARTEIFRSYNAMKFQAVLQRADGIVYGEERFNLDDAIGSLETELYRLENDSRYRHLVPIKRRN